MFAGISYSNAQCVAGFTSNVNMVNGQYGTGLVQFTDTSHASVGDTLISWAWSFGDGVTANIKNPIHYYPTPGNYTVTLFVHDNSSNNGTQQQFLINTAYPVGCQAYINYAYPQPYPTVPGPHVPISFLSNANLLPTNDAIANVLWNFGDGTTSTLLNPVHTYSQDTTFLVSYTLNTSGANNAVTFFAEENYWGFLSSAHTYTWTYSDGYIDTTNLNSYGFYNMRPYVAGQVYDTTLTVTGGGCNASSTQTVDFSVGACNLSPLWSWNTNYFLFQNQYPLKINANTANGAGTAASRTYLWNNGSTAPYVYAYSSGEYCVTITDSLGCSKTLCYTYYAPHDSLITLCGNVYNDANNNGIFDGAETPTGSSNTVQITNGSTTYNASVDGTGYYSANVPAGNYMTTYASTAGHNFITPTTPDSIAHYANVTATYGNNLCGYNFGISNNTSFIGGKLFYDDDSDGVLDSTEIGIAYQPISAGIYTVFTDSLGYFKFNVVANN